MKLFIPVSILFFAFAHTGISQITITQSDMPQPGDTLRVSTSADTIGLPTPALTGAGITWNYAALVPLTQTIDTFISVSSTPFAYQLFFNDGFLYPNYKATVAQNGMSLPPLGPLTVTQVVNYYKTQSSSYESVGYGANIDFIPTSVKDDTIDVVYNLPMNYGNADSCHSGSHTTVPLLGYYGQFQYRINHVEGWGTLITPYGTFSTLKVKTILFNSDSLYVDTFHLGFRTPQVMQIQYKWLANGQHIPLLQINERSPSGPRQYIYRDSVRNELLGISDVKAESGKVEVYPNPSRGIFELEISHAGLVSASQPTINVYNTLGQEVYFETLKQVQGDNEIDLSNHPNGIYFYRVVSTDGSLIGEGKMILEK